MREISSGRRDHSKLTYACFLVFLGNLASVSEWTERRSHANKVKEVITSKTSTVDQYDNKPPSSPQNKGTVPRPAPILEYPPPDRPWDVVSMDLLQLPASNQGSKYLLVCLDFRPFFKVCCLSPYKRQISEFCCSWPHYSSVLSLLHT